MAALVPFGLSISVKYVPVVLVPFYLALVVRRLRGGEMPWWRVGVAVAWRVGVVALVIVLTALPFWAGPATLGALRLSPPAQQLGNSPARSHLLAVAGAGAGVGLRRRRRQRPREYQPESDGLLAFAALWLWQFRRARSSGGHAHRLGLDAALVCADRQRLVLAVVCHLGRRGRRAPAGGGCWRRHAAARRGAATLYAFLSLYAAGVYGLRALVAFGPGARYLGCAGGGVGAPAALAFARYTVFHRERTGAAPGARSRLSTWPTVRSRRRHRTSDERRRRIALGMPI